MQWTRWTRRLAGTIALIVATLIILGIDPVAAHGGHAHENEGVDATVVLQVGGTVAVLGIAYLLATRLYRARDAAHGDAPADKSDTVR